MLDRWWTIIENHHQNNQETIEHNVALDRWTALSRCSVSYLRKRNSLSIWLDYLTDPFKSDGCIETIELRLQ